MLAPLFRVSSAMTVIASPENAVASPQMIKDIASR
jgi:hypothetical protein